MKEIGLSKRMEAVVNMVSPQSFAIADVGCDHAYVSIALKQRNLAQKVIAMDVRSGPLSIAKKNVAAYGLEEDIELRLGNGLERLSAGETDTIIIAGMGGLLIKSILEQGKQVLCCEQPPVLILQPQSDIREVRIFLYRQAYHIVEETMLVEEDKFYTVIKAEYGKEPGYETEAEWVYGKCNIQEKTPVFQQFLEKESRTLEEIAGRLQMIQGRHSERTRKRAEDIRKKQEINETARREVCR